MNRFTLFTLAIIASAATISPVIAAEPSAAVAVVGTADLDLTNARDVRILDHRLSIAIVEACGAASNVDLAGRNQVRACRADARARVNAERDRLVELAGRGSDVVLAAR